jgi:membrane-associated phospholipid phosphatase
VLPAVFPALIAWGAGVIEALQAASTPVLDALFTGVTLLGQEPLFLLLAPILFWCVGKRFGLRVAGLVVATLCVNEALKAWVAEPRPFLVHAAIQAKVLARGYSFPSGHAQLSATVWPVLAARAGRRWFTALAGVLIAAVAFSRVYLGVHYPHDVAAGIVVGLLVAALAMAAEARLRPLLGPRRAEALLVLGIAGAAALLAALIERDVLLVLGGALGASGGWLLEERLLAARLVRGPRACAARILLGGTLLGAAYLAIDRWAGPGALALPLYALLGGAATLGVPWLFVRLGLMTADRGAPCSPLGQRGSP